MLDFGGLRPRQGWRPLRYRANESEPPFRKNARVRGQVSETLHIYSDFTVIRRGLVFSLFGNVMVSTPNLNSADTLSAFTSLGS